MFRDFFSEYAIRAYDRIRAETTVVHSVCQDIFFCVNRKKGELRVGLSAGPTGRMHH